MPSLASPVPTSQTQAHQALVIRFPQRDETDVPQDDEWCEVVDGDDAVTTVRFHDYAHIFSIPGLYNQLFGGVASETKCISPQVMADLLREHLHRLGSTGAGHQGPARLRVLDFGAGNGMIGEEVRRLVGSHEDESLASSTLLVGFDILPAAKLAAERDRPGVYDDYIVADITDYVDRAQARHQGFQTAKFNVLVSVSALAFGDASVAAFKAAISLVESRGLVLFNLKAGLLDHVTADGAQETGMESVNPDTGFSNLIQEAVDSGKLEILARKTYCHRFSVTGKPLYYVAVAAQVL